MIQTAVLVPVPVASTKDVLAIAYAMAKLGIVMITAVWESIYLEVVSVLAPPAHSKAVCATVYVGIMMAIARAMVAMEQHMSEWRLPGLSLWYKIW